MRVYSDRTCLLLPTPKRACALVCIYYKYVNKKSELMLIRRATAVVAETAHVEGSTSLYCGLLESRESKLRLLKSKFNAESFTCRLSWSISSDFGTIQC